MCGQCVSELWCTRGYLISSDRLEPNVSISFRDCDKVFYRSTPCMEMDTISLNYSVDASTLSFVCSSLMTGIGYYGFLKLCEAASFNAAFSARKYYSTNQLLLGPVHIFFLEMPPLILPTIRNIYGADGDGMVKVDVSFIGTWMTRDRKSHANIGFLIKCEAGFVLDFAVVFNFCILCAKRKNKLSEAEYAAWYEHTKMIAT